MEFDVVKNVIPASGLKCGDVFRLSGLEDSYYIFLERIDEGPEIEDNYYRILDIKYNIIKNVAYDFFRGRRIYNCKAKIQITDNN